MKVGSQKVERWLRRRGLVRDDAEADTPHTAADACMRAALQRGTFEQLGPQDRTQANGDQEEDGRFDHRKRSPWAAEINGFSVHAGVHNGDGKPDIALKADSYQSAPVTQGAYVGVLLNTSR